MNRKDIIKAEISNIHEYNNENKNKIIEELSCFIQHVQAIRQTTMFSSSSSSSNFFPKHF